MTMTERILEIWIRPGNTKSWFILTTSMIQAGPLNFFNFNFLFQSNEYNSMCSVKKNSQDSLRTHGRGKTSQSRKNIHQIHGESVIKLNHLEDSLMMIMCETPILKRLRGVTLSCCNNFILGGRPVCKIQGTLLLNTRHPLDGPHNHLCCIRQRYLSWNAFSHLGCLKSFPWIFKQQLLSLIKSQFSLFLYSFKN